MNLIYVWFERGFSWTKQECFRFLAVKWLKNWKNFLNVDIQTPDWAAGTGTGAGTGIGTGIGVLLACVAC